MTSVDDAHIQALVYIVDDDEAMRDALCTLMRSVGLTAKAFAGADGFIDSCDSSNRGCLLLDMRMPGISGLELLDYVKRRALSIPVILISGHGNVRQVVKAMRMGAFDFLEKPFDDQELLDLVNRALRHHTELIQHERWLNAARESYSNLTERERTVLIMITRGSLNKQMASELSISIRTVENHRARVMEKMRVKSVVELVRLAIALNLIDCHPQTVHQEPALAR